MKPFSSKTDGYWRPVKWKEPPVTRITVYEGSRENYLGEVSGTHEYAVELGCAAHKAHKVLLIFVNNWRVW